MTDLALAIEKVKKLGINIDRNGRMLCPFHNDHNPSAYIYYNRYHEQVEFHCFGCGKSYSFEHFLELIDGESKKEDTKSYDFNFIADRLNKNFLAILSGAGEEKEKRLAQSGLKYLSERGFGLEEIETFKIGFCLREDLLSVKEFNNNSWCYDENRLAFLVFPIRNREGKVVSFQFEDFLNRGKLEVTKLNLTGRKRSLAYFGEYSPNKPYFITEAIYDALSLLKTRDIFTFGVVSLLGSPSEEQIKELIELAKTNDVILALDNDESGRKMEEKLLKELVLINPYIRAVRLPDGIKDLNELLLREGQLGIEDAILFTKKVTPFGNIRERVPQILEKFRMAKENAFPIPEQLSYLREFFKDGLLPGLYGVAGIPGVGKTTWLNILCDELAKIGYKSIYFLTEEPEYRLLLRTIKREGLKNFEELISQDWIENRITFELTPEYTAETLEGIISGIIEREGKAIFIMDSLHALQMNNSLDTREKTILKTELLAHISRDLLIPVFFTSFIPKSLYKEKPNIGAFKEAGEIEYLIDVGIVLWRDLEEKKDDKIPVSLHIVKNRFGKTGEARLVFETLACSIREPEKGETLR
ncbi:toprim domain-containing protein [bacterium]|nr:toprim domain-containing protein [bacterium]